MPDQPEKPNQIFISYRRDDTAGVVGRIYDRLVQRFGKEAIFKDVDSIPLGKDFRRHIDAVVSDCCVALIVVGDRWLVSGGTGANRLDDPRDYVRLEIEAVLKRDIPVIPLLVQNASLPTDEKLPESIKDFTYRNGMSIGHDPHFHADMDRLIKHLEVFIEGRSHQENEQSRIPSTPVAPNEQVDHTANGPSLEDNEPPIANVSEPEPLPPETGEPLVLNVIQHVENKEASKVDSSAISLPRSSDDRASEGQANVQASGGHESGGAALLGREQEEAHPTAALPALNTKSSLSPKKLIVGILVVIGSIICYVIIVVALGTIGKATGISPVLIWFGAAAVVAILGAIWKRIR